MNITQCQRCSSKFHVTIPDPDICCPFCGYSLKSSGVTGRKEGVTRRKREREGEGIARRKAIREVVVENCVIKNGFGKLSTLAVDISETGIGLYLSLKTLPFYKGNNVQIDIINIDLKNEAEVMWIKKFADSSSRAGLRFR